MNTNFDLPFDPIKEIDPDELIAIILGLQGNASITAVVTAEGYSEVIEGVDPQSIRYITETDTLHVGGLGCPYSLSIKPMDMVSALYNDTEWQFDIPGDAVTLSILVQLEAK